MIRKYLVVKTHVSPMMQFCVMSETKKCVQVHVGWVANTDQMVLKNYYKSGNGYAYLDSFEEGKQWLINNTKAEIAKTRVELKRLTGRLQNQHKLKEF